MRDKFEARPALAPPIARARAAAAGRAARDGFTLVEVLMVILIISMLIALLLPAVQAAKVSAIKASIKMDVNQLVNAMNEFKAKYGSYPPDRNWTIDEIRTFLHRAFPRYTPPQATFDQTVAQIKTLDEAESLVFWLGGRWDGTHMTGFSADPTADPFAMGGQRTTPFLTFTETRLVDRNNNGFPEYYPPNIDISQAAPYVCFAARPNGKYWNMDSGSPTRPQYTPGGMNTTAVPYHYKQLDQPNNAAQSYWMKPTEFQIICAGIDNDYGANADKVFPFGTGYNAADNDNIVSFTERTLGDAQP